MENRKGDYFLLDTRLDDRSTILSAAEVSFLKETHDHILRIKSIPSNTDIDLEKLFDIGAFYKDGDKILNLVQF